MHPRRSVRCSGRSQSIPARSIPGVCLILWIAAAFGAATPVRAEDAWCARIVGGPPGTGDLAVAVVRPGTGPIAIPPAALRIALDLRNLPNADGVEEAIVEAIAASIATPVARPFSSSHPRRCAIGPRRGGSVGP